MSLKYCSSCAAEKPITDFHIHRTKGIQNSCKECRATYNRNHYQANKKEYRKARYRVAANLKEWYAGLKTDKPCTDCGKCFHFSGMEWDHLPGKGKVANVSRLLKNGSKKAILEEIKKCELVCAVCHAYRTWKRTR